MAWPAMTDDELEILGGLEQGHLDRLKRLDDDQYVDDMPDAELLRHLDDVRLEGEYARLRTKHKIWMRHSMSDRA